MNKWLPEPNPHLQRRLGKTGEEAAELAEAAARVACVCARGMIQGLDAVDPASGKTNRQRLLEELADVEAQTYCTLKAIKLTVAERGAYGERVLAKVDQMGRWEEHYHEDKL